ncbi:uncharacterized protein LOC142229992 [Haematobia irritans]|uniref:uncharacterized protein LOC142229992 n=1 Tax=Haematobia irritans TaxID=7368 RepID=UPI003F502EE3
MPTINTPDKLEYKFFPISNGIFTFRIRAANDAHLALTSQPNENLPMYEIFIGGWGNTKSVIRRNRQQPDVVEVPTPRILQANDYRGFWIRWYNQTITVGRQGEAMAFMSYRDPQLFPINYVGICTGWGASGSWIFDDHTPSAPSMTIYPNVSQINTGLPPGFNPMAMGYAPQPVPPTIAYPPQPVAPTGTSTIAYPSPTGSHGNWIPASNGVVPPNAVSGGFDGSDQLYVARAYHGSDLIPGKLHPSHGCCYVPYGGEEHSHRDYEVLCNSYGRWIPCNGNGVPPNAIPGGRTGNGEPLYIGRVHHNGTMTVGKFHPSHRQCFIPYGGKEMSFNDFEIYVSN